MLTKFTPGPWFASEHRDHVVFVHSIAGIALAEILGLNSPERVKANATLIAAAPEMYALLERVEKLIDRDANAGQTYDSYVYASGVSSEIARLLAKARGES